MRKSYLFFAIGFIILCLGQSCQKSDTTSGNNGGGGGGGVIADSVYLPTSFTWTDFGFASASSYTVGALFDAQKRVTKIAGFHNTSAKPFYYPDGRLSHVVFESPPNVSGPNERNSTVFHYSGNKIVKAVYKVASTLPETSTYYSDTIRTDNNTGYYDSLVYGVNNMPPTEIYTLASTWLQGKVLIKYPSGSDSTYSIQDFNGSPTVTSKISGTISNIANPYAPYWSLHYMYRNQLAYFLLLPDPLRKEAYECEYMLSLLPYAIRTYKVEWFTGAYSMEQGTYLYQMSADSLNLKMTIPGNPAYNYQRDNFYYTKVPK